MNNISENLLPVNEEKYYRYEGELGRVRISFPHEQDPVYLLYKEKPSSVEISHYLKEELLLFVDNYTLTWG